MPNPRSCNQSKIPTHQSTSVLTERYKTLLGCSNVFPPPTNLATRLKKLSTILRMFPLDENVENDKTDTEKVFRLLCSSLRDVFNVSIYRWPCFLLKLLQDVSDFYNFLFWKMPLKLTGMSVLNAVQPRNFLFGCYFSNSTEKIRWNILHACFSLREEQFIFQYRKYDRQSVCNWCCNDLTSKNSRTESMTHCRQAFVYESPSFHIST